MKKAMSVVFIIMISFFGIVSSFNSADSVAQLVKTEGLNSKLPSSIESELQENMYLRHGWINIHGFIQRLFGRTIVEDGAYNTIYKLKSGSISAIEYHKSDSKINKFANNVQKLKSKIPGNIDFMYIQLPHKIGSVSELPVGVKSYADDSADRLLQCLEEREIECLDVRKLINDSQLNWPSLFYKTDHHWRPQTASWTASKITEYLSEKHAYSYDPSVYDPANMQTEVFPRLFLGSAGRRTGSLYDGIDDFELYTPKYETSFEFTSYPGNTHIYREGDFREALIDKSNLKEDHYNINNYAAYTGDSTKTTITINKLNPVNDKKVLLIRDSFSCALQPFLSLSFKEIETLDLRYYRDETVIDHIKENDYDLVIVAYNAQSFDSQRFSFHKIPG